MSEIIINETRWEDLQEIRDYETNSVSYEMAIDAYNEAKETGNY